MSVDKQAPKKPGRRPKSVDEGLTKTLGFRLRPSLRAKLEEASRREGRSVSEEVEARVSRSFFLEEMDRHRSGDADLSFLSTIFVSMAGLVQAKTGKKFNEDAETRIGIVQALSELMDSVPDIFKDSVPVEQLHRRFTDAELRAAAEPVADAAGAASTDYKPMSAIMGR